MRTGVILGSVVLRGVMERRKVHNIVFRDFNTGRTGRLGDHPQVLLRWLVQHYPVQVQQPLPAVLNTAEVGQNNILKANVLALT